MTVMWICIAIAWVIGAILAYQVIKKWGKSKFETIWYSFFWPVLIPLYLIHKIHNS
jgi:hypothetical protein